MAESTCHVGEIEICYETFGDPADPAILLIMGLGTQMVAWHEDFCAELAERGFFVIRHDNRDIGRSTHLDQLPIPSLVQLAKRDRNSPYTLADMAADSVGVLDHLGIEKAHIVGASMGGMIAQTLAIRFPQRALSLVSIMSNTGGFLNGQPALTMYAVLLRPGPRDREGFIEHGVRDLRQDRRHRLPAGRRGPARDRDDAATSAATTRAARSASCGRSSPTATAAPTCAACACRPPSSTAPRTSSCARPAAARRRRRSPARSWSRSTAWATACRAAPGRRSSARSRTPRPRRAAGGLAQREDRAPTTQQQHQDHAAGDRASPSTGAPSSPGPTGRACGGLPAARRPSRRHRTSGTSSLPISSTISVSRCTRCWR